MYEAHMYATTFFIIFMILSIIDCNTKCIQQALALAFYNVFK